LWSVEGPCRSLTETCAAGCIEGRGVWVQAEGDGRKAPSPEDRAALFEAEVAKLCARIPKPKPTLTGVLPLRAGIGSDSLLCEG
jgi:hypothetical protein